MRLLFRASNEVVRFLARTLGLPKSSVTVERGTTSRTKHIALPDGTGRLFRTLCGDMP